MTQTLTNHSAIVVPVGRIDSHFIEAFQSIIDANPVSTIYIVADTGFEVPDSLLQDKTPNLHFLFFTKAEIESKGIGNKLNFAINLIKEKIVFRMDADDIWLPGRESTQILELETYAVVTSEPILINSNGFKIPDFRPKIPTGFVWEPLFLLTNPINHPSTAIAKVVLDKVGGYRNAYPEDLDLWLRLVNRDFKIFMSGKKCIKYRRHRNQISISNNSSRYIDALIEQEYVMLKTRHQATSKLSQANVFCRNQSCLDPECDKDEYLILIRDVNRMINTKDLDFFQYKRRIAFEAMIWLRGHGHLIQEILTLRKILGFKILLPTLIRFGIQGVFLRVYGVR